MLRQSIIFASLTALALWPAAGRAAERRPAEKAVPLEILEELPVREITVFKDGHAFVLHEGAMPTDENGDVRMDYLPRPVLGTFWPYAKDDKAKLTGVTAGRRRVMVKRTALSLRELLEANVGKKVEITEVGGAEYRGDKYAATIVGFPERGAEERAATEPPSADEALPQKGELALLATENGTKAIPVSRIQDVTFLEKPESDLAQEEFRDLLRLDLDWGGSAPLKSANVGLIYLQRGVRWISGNSERGHPFAMGKRRSEQEEICPVGQ